MKDYSKAFKAYDIRGIYNVDIDTTLSYNIGKAIGKYILDKFGKEGNFIFGGDVRNANNDIIAYFLQGMEKVGFNNYFCAGIDTQNIDGEKYTYGVVSTSMLYYLCYQSFDIGCSFTASHNSAEYVGMKIFDTSASLLATEDIKGMIPKITPLIRGDRGVLQNYQYTPPSPPYQGGNKIIQNKLKQRKDFFHNKFFEINNKYKIVVDLSNGAGCTYEKSFLEQIEKGNPKLKFIFINDVADSNFSAHESNTSVESNYQQLSKAVKEQKADFGIMFDGDVDRIGFVDENGKYHSSDIVLTIITDALVAREKKDFVCDVMCTKALDDVAKKHGVKCIRSRVGYRFVKEIMLKNNGCLGGELSGHILFPETGSFENPIFALYNILKVMDQKDQSISSILADLHPYYKPGISNYKVDNPDKIIEIIKEKYKDYKIDETDGIKIIRDKRRFIVRRSQTEPIVRLSMEADNEDIWKEEMEKVEKLIYLK